MGELQTHVYAQSTVGNKVRHFQYRGICVPENHPIKLLYLGLRSYKPPIFLLL